MTYAVVDIFEKRIAAWAGSKYAVTCESCTAAIFLCLQYRKLTQAIDFVELPKHTYPGVACSIIHSGGKIAWTDEVWEGEYELKPLGIIDSALRFKRGMYHGGLHCLSFHIKKHLPIGRGGMILTDDLEAYNWLKRARFDGRNPVSLLEDDFTMLGWNMYIQPQDAARGMMLFDVVENKDLPDIKVSEQGYPDLSKFKVYET
jgi:dTDP-4-amino-4,6-dideoxygalactose transaminase